MSFCQHGSEQSFLFVSCFYIQHEATFKDEICHNNFTAPNNMLMSSTHPVVDDAVSKQSRMFGFCCFNLYICIRQGSHGHGKPVNIKKF